MRMTKYNALAVASVDRLIDEGHIEPTDKPDAIRWLTNVEDNFTWEYKTFRQEAYKVPHQCKKCDFATLKMQSLFGMVYHELAHFINDLKKRRNVGRVLHPVIGRN